MLRDIGVTAVVDLRSEHEITRDPTPDLASAGIRLIHAPVHDAASKPRDANWDFQGFPALYEEMLADGQSAYRILFETISDSRGRVLFHCAAGKDRTGVGAALLLLLAGVSPDDVAEDYSHSQALLALMPAGLRVSAATAQFSPELRARLGVSRADEMLTTIEHLGERYGGVEGYLAEIGLSGAVRDAVQSRMLAPAS
jgi:protein-tyrosine phosphatase